MKKRHLLPVLLLAAALMLLAACGEHILPPKETETPTNMPMPTPTPTPMPSPFTGSIEGMEINQALSFGVNSDTGEFYPVSEFVARRDTAVFVRLSGELGHAPDERDYLEVYRDGELLSSHAPHALSTPESLCYILSGEEAAALGADIYEFRAVVDGEVHSRFAQLQETRALRVLLVPVLGNFGGNSSYPGEGWQDYLWHMQACWPLANDGLKSVTAPGMDLSGEAYDLSRGRGMWNAWEALRERAGLLGDYDLVVGLVSGSMGEGNDCDGFGRDGVALINTAQTAPEAAISHFAGHALGAGDEYEGGLFSLHGNPAPMGTVGIDAQTRETITAARRGVEKASDYGLYCDSSVVRAAQVPLDIPRQRLLGDAASFMGDATEYTQNYWISSDLWSLLFKVLQPENSSPTKGTLPEGCTHTLRVSGLLGQDGGVVMRGAMTVPDGSAGDTPWNTEAGSYKLSFVDETGAFLRSYWFDLDFLCLTDPPTARTLAPFDLALPVPAGAAAMQLYGPTVAEDGTPPELELLYEEHMAAQATESVFAVLPESEGLHGIVRVEWVTPEPEPAEDGEAPASTEEDEEEKPEPIRTYYELYMHYDDVDLLVYRGELRFAELDMLSLPKPERFTLRLLTCAGGWSTLTESEVLEYPQ